MTRRKIILITTGIAIALTIGLGMYWQKAAAAEKAIKTTTPRRQDLVKTLEISGVVDAHERVLMRFAQSGKLIYLGAKEGDAVQRGQTIASLDRRSVQKTIEKELSEYQSERWDFENGIDGRKDRAIDTTERRTADQAQFSLNRSVLDVEIQSLVAENYRLSAPFSGILVSSPVNSVGINILATDIFELVNPESLYFRAAVDEVDVDSLQVGQEVEIRLDSASDTVLKAVVEKIAYASSETTSGTVFGAQIHFLDGVNIEKQRVGMNGDAAIVLEKKSNVLSVPLSALTSNNGDSYVKVLNGQGKTEERQVEVGIETETDIEIVSGLSEQDQVVLP